MGDDRGVLRVPLRRFRWARRPAYVELTDGSLEIHAPGLLRDRTWRTPVSQVAVVDPSAPEPDGGVGMGPLAFVDPVTLRYLPTTSSWVGPNLQLLFQAPLAVPRGLLPGGTSTIDGVSLRAVNPATAVEALARAGMKRTSTPLAWLMGRREMTTALHARASAVTRQSADHGLRVGAVVLLPVLAGTAWWAEQARSGVATAAFVVECAAAAVLPAVLRRRDRA